MQLAKTVRQTYFNRFSEMELEYQLHFASRLFAWSKDRRAYSLLQDLRNTVMPPTHEARRSALLAIRDELAVKDYERDVNDYARRKPYFEKYPNLLLLHNALFRIRHWKCIYNIDERNTLYELIPKEQVQALLAQLDTDTDAQVILSTYFINTSYLYEKLYQDTTVTPIDPYGILELGQRYDRSNKTDVQILIYLYTHCILGETLFYFQPITRHQEVYRNMLMELDALLLDNFQDINLDNKFEFLVCSRICSYEPKSVGRIYEEAEQSCSKEGFITDMYNNNINPKKQSFMMSEHRNVLYLMSLSDPAFIS